MPQGDPRKAIRDYLIVMAKGRKFTPEQLEAEIDRRLGVQTQPQGQPPIEAGGQRVPPRGVRSPEQIAAENAADPYLQSTGGAGDVLERTLRDVGVGLVKGATAPGRWVGKKLGIESLQPGGRFDEWAEQEGGDAMGTRGLSMNPILGTVQSAIAPAAEMAGQGAIAGPMMGMMKGASAASGAEIANLAAQKGWRAGGEIASKAVSNVGKNLGLVSKYPTSATTAMGAVRAALPGAVARGTVANLATNPEGFDSPEGAMTNIAFSALDALSAGRAHNLARGSIAPEGTPKSESWWSRLTRDPGEDLATGDVGAPPPTPGPDVGGNAAGVGGMDSGPASVKAAASPNKAGLPQNQMPEPTAPNPAPRPLKPARPKKGSEPWRNITDQQAYEAKQNPEIQAEILKRYPNQGYEKPWEKLSPGQRSSYKRVLGERGATAEATAPAAVPASTSGAKNDLSSFNTTDPNLSEEALRARPVQPEGSVNGPGPTTPETPEVTRVGKFKKEEGFSARQTLINNAPRKNIEGVGADLIDWDSLDKDARRQLIQRAQTGNARAFADKYVDMTAQELLADPYKRKAFLEAISGQKQTREQYAERVANAEARRAEKAGKSGEKVETLAPVAARPRGFTPVRPSEPAAPATPVKPAAPASAKAKGLENLRAAVDEVDAANAAVEGTKAAPEAKSVTADEYGSWNSAQKRRALVAAGLDKEAADKMYSKKFEELPAKLRAAMKDEARAAATKAAGSNPAGRTGGEKIAETIKAAEAASDDVAGRSLRPLRLPRSK